MTREETAIAFAQRLASFAPVDDHVVIWPMARLRVRTFVPFVEPPDTLVTSVRAIVFKGSRVVVVREKSGGRHILPGGRREAGETQEQTVRREVLEECGWHIGSLHTFALMHFEHLDPIPTDAVHPWQDFAHPVHVAEAARYDRSAMDSSQIEAGASLMSIKAARAALTSDQITILDRALAARRAS